MICVSIIYRVRIISISNTSGGFMVSDTLSLLNAYQIVNDNSVMSDRYTYLCCHLYKALTTQCAQDIILNHFAYLEVVKGQLTDSIRQIYYSDRRDNAHSGKKYHPILLYSSSSDIFSLMVSPLSVPSSLDN